MHERPFSGTWYPNFRNQLHKMRVRIFLATCVASIFLSGGRVPMWERVAPTEPISASS